jgi:phage terminase large subunit-like protein
VSARYEGHKVYHHRSLQNSAFEVELLSFPKGHDDQVDALGYAMDLAGHSLVFGSVRR